MHVYEHLYYYRLNPENAFKEFVFAFDRLMFKAIHNVVYNFRNVCFSVQDCYQETLLALLMAINGYREDYHTQFSSYLYKCCELATKVIVRKHDSQSFGLLDRCISFEYEFLDDESLKLEDIVADETSWYSPIAMNYFYELNEETNAIIATLKPIEQQVFHYRNCGYSYEMIAQHCGLTTKKVDNILLKIRRKVKERI